MLSFFEPYLAVIGDIKDSRHLADRREVQNRLKKILDEINDIYEEDISSRFLITLGDEFQGLLNRGDNVIQIISVIEQKMYPVKLRFGVGIGKITTEIIAEAAIGADGPGYYEARDAIEYLKENEKRKKRAESNIRIGIEEPDRLQSLMLNTILSLMSVIKESWSERQREIIYDMLDHGDGQSDVARRLGVSQPTVQKCLAAGNYYSYKEGLDALSEALKRIGRADV